MKFNIPSKNKLFFLFFSFLFICFSPFYSFSNEINLIYKNSSNKARILFNYEKHIDSEIFILKNPTRLVVDFKTDLPIKNFFKKINFISKHRVGNPFKGIKRVAFDLENKLKHYTYTPIVSFSGNTFGLIIDLYFESDVSNSSKTKKTIVVDPGHGGRDPAAMRGNFKEKEITLLSGKYLAKKLRNLGYNVFLTRENDKFVRLANRVKFARQKSADLFISIHADSTLNKNTRGLSIYSLSERASDKLAQSLAESENKVDLIGGIDLEQYEEEVSDILIDIERRGTKNSSIEFAELVIKKFKNSDVFLLRRPHRQAGFAVLKAPDIPSVLLEMGFISNKTDFNLLLSKSYREKILDQLAITIDKYLREEHLN